MVSRMSKEKARDGGHGIRCLFGLYDVVGRTEDEVRVLSVLFVSLFIQKKLEQTMYAVSSLGQGD